MTLPEQAQNNRVWHVAGLVCGVLAILSSFVVPSGVVGYLVAVSYTHLTLPTILLV